MSPGRDLTIAAALALGLFAALPARGNDASAGLANGGLVNGGLVNGGLVNGGLVLQQSRDMALQSERLEISAKEIHATYRFVNRGDQPATTIVAFPLPEIRPPAYSYDKLSLPSDDPENAFHFSALVDGKPVALSVEEKAFARDGTDRAAVLRSLRIPTMPWSPRTFGALNALPKEKGRELVRLGLAYESSDNMPGSPIQLAPAWRLKSTYFWQQTFPPGREVVIEHRYMPSVSTAVDTALDLGLRYRGDAEAQKHLADYRRKYCVTDELTRKLLRARQRDDTLSWREQRIDYLLSTGANGAGPIGEFELVLHKSSPEDLVSACEPLVPSGRTDLVMRKKNFMPKKDLAILFLHIPRQDD